MTNVTNSHTAALGLPTGVTIAAGKTVPVENWDAVKDHPVVAAWVSAGALKVSGKTPEPAAAAYVLKDKGQGWFAIQQDGKDVTKGLRKDAVEGFDALSAEKKTAFVEANKAD